jgi:hypothetical protein
MGDEAHIPNSYQLRDDFKPKSENADKNTVLGTDSSIGTETSQVAWETYGKDLDTLVKYRDSIKSVGRRYGQELARPRQLTEYARQQVLERSEIEDHRFLGFERR